jgi:Ca-activated chloride channel family protein
MTRPPVVALSALAFGLLLTACATKENPATLRLEDRAAADAAVVAPPPRTAVAPPARVEAEALAAAEVDASATSAPRMQLEKKAEAQRDRRAALGRSTAAPAAALGIAPQSRADFYAPPPVYAPAPVENREKYQNLQDNPVKLASADNLSTLSLDVDTGSYSNVRRFLNQGQLPPQDAVRVEELVNYFSYSYPQAVSGHPFSVSTEVAKAPWNPEHLLLRVGVKTMEQHVSDMPPANLVFLVDVSGSMNERDKLPLVQSTLKLLVEQLRPQDRVALVVYAGRTAVELPSTPGNQKHKILVAISRLSAGGSTAGEAALRLAYEQARAGYVKGGINRILLATDGDFNVGISDIGQIKDIVARERESGISLTTLGFGQGNYQEALMEQIADVGNGNYSYIDSLAEARKVLVEELSSTFNTVAKDVKIQVEFNPDQVAEWRLIGYENRVLREEDFRNDKVDAGDVGAGKSVTALYEITPVGSTTLHGERRYGAEAKRRTDISRELAFLRIRYKQPEASRAVELAQAINRPDAATLARTPSRDLRFAGAVAAFGQLLRQSPYTGTFGYADVRALAQQGLDDDRTGYRREFLRLVDLAAALTPSQPDVAEQEKITTHVDHTRRYRH